MLGERDRKRRRAVGLSPHPHGKRLEALEQYPGVERRYRRAGLTNKDMDLFHDEFLRSEDNSAEAARLAIDVLGGRIHDAVGAKRERTLKQRRREHVVDD